MSLRLAVQHFKYFFYPNCEPFLGFVVANFGRGPQWTISSTTCHNCIIWCIVGRFFFHLKQLIQIMPSLSTVACRWRLFRWCWKEESVFISRVVKYTDLELLIKRSLAQLQKGGCVHLCSNRDLEMCPQNVIGVWVVGLFACLLPGPLSIISNSTTPFPPLTSLFFNCKISPLSTRLAQNEFDDFKQKTNFVCVKCLFANEY